MPTWLQPITVDGVACLLVLPEINWRTRPRITHTLEISATEGRTGIEARAADHVDVRLAVDYLYTLDGAIADEFLTALLALAPTSRLALPLWPDKLPAADYLAQRKWYSAHWININTATGAFGVDLSVGAAECVGLAICSLLERPRITAKTERRADIVLRAEEDSPWESQIYINELEQTTWDFEPNWVNRPEDNSRWQLKRRRLGHGRLSTRTGTDAPTKRGQIASFTLQGNPAIRRALTFWTQHGGPHTPFTVPRYLRPAWDGAPETVPVMQARFAEESLVLEFSAPNVATTRLGFNQELLLEEGEPAQARPSRAYLFKVWWEGSATLMTWTDWAQSYIHSGINYVPRAIECQAATETLIAGQNDWTLLVEDFVGNPLRAFGRLALERRLLIEIREFNPAVADTAALVFSGEIKSAPNKGPIYTATAALFGDALKYLVPGQFVQTACNNTFCDDLCGLDIEDYKVVGTIAADSDLTVVDVTCGSAMAADYYALGFATFGAGDDVELRFVLRSAPITGGQRLTLNRPLWNGGSGDAVALYPGCDQQFEGGCARYGNQGAFFGAPYKPAYIETVNSGFKTKTGK